MTYLSATNNNMNHDYLKDKLINYIYVHIIYAQKYSAVDLWIVRLLFWTIVPLQFFCDVITLIAVNEYVHRCMSWRTAIAESNIACQFGFRLRSVQDFSPRPNPVCVWYYSRCTDNRLTHSASRKFVVVVIAKLYFEITNMHRILHIDLKCLLHGISMLRKINANVSATKFHFKHVQYMVYI